MQSIFAAILPSPLVGAATLIIRYLDVKGTGLGMQVADGRFPVEIRRFENIITTETIELAMQSSSKDSKLSTSIC